MTDEIQTAASESSGTTQFSYSVAEFDILLEPTVKTEIVEQRDIFLIPHAPEWCRGMISLRGKLIPVINIHRLLGRVLNAPSFWLLIVEADDLPPAAIRIDKLPVQHHIQDDVLKTLEDEDSMPFWIKRSGFVDGKTVYDADHTELFQLLVLQNQPIPASNHPTHTDSSGHQV